MKNRRMSFVKDESGAVAVLVSIMIILLLGCAALAVDLGHLYTVRQELQNAAEAGAMAGARALVPFVNLPAPVPYWGNGVAVATQTVQANKGDGALLTNCQVETGYWNFTTKTMQSVNIIPTPADVPAVRVTVRKTEGQNGGPVNLLFARVWGRYLADVGAEATAIISGAGSVNPGGLFPIAVSEALVNEYWNHPEYIFEIISVYHTPIEDQFGQWTSLTVDENNVPYIRYLETEGNPTQVSVGDDIWIQPGTESTLFMTADTFVYPHPPVTLPVVDPASFETHDWTKILKFVCFQITEVAPTGQGKYIKGHFVSDNIDPDANPGGPIFGNFATPKLVH